MWFEEGSDTWFMTWLIIDLAAGRTDGFLSFAVFKDKFLEKEQGKSFKSELGCLIYIVQSGGGVHFLSEFSHKK